MESEINLDKIKFENPKEKEGTMYLTHNFHTYPAKFIPQIPKATILNFTNEGDTILDPFCGCGTTLVECKLNNRNGIGVDLNPIATLVSKVKTTKLNEDQIKKLDKVINLIERDINLIYDKNKNYDNFIPDFKNIDHWFQKNVLQELGAIKKNIIEITDIESKEFMFSIFSAILVTVSNQESNTRFAAINKSIPNLSVLNSFKRKYLIMIKKIKEFSEVASDTKIVVYQENSENLDFLQDNSIDHIVTSPPYANTYDYYLYHKFRILWLDYDLKKVQNEEIGSRNRHSSKKEEIDTFEISLKNCIKEFSRVLKPNKYLVIVIGDSILRGKLIRADEIIENICKNTKFKIVKKQNYKLSSASKMFNPKFTNKDKLEHILFLKNEK